ncbi:putative disease resistance RPP13-like protein 1 [Bienertia sinuspersici]
MAEVILETLLEKLASSGIDYVVKYVKGKKIDPKTIDNLKINLKKITALLNDAQQRHVQSDDYNLWVEELQDLAYDLEDILDELATDEQLRRLEQAFDDDDDHDGGRSASKARNVACLRSIKTLVCAPITSLSRLHFFSYEILLRINLLYSSTSFLHTQCMYLMCIIVNINN